MHAGSNGQRSPMKPLLVIIAALFLLAPLVSATHCTNGYGTSVADSDTVIKFSGPVGPSDGFYTVVDLPGGECGASSVGNFWLYEEENDISGLQRADSCRDDTCGGLIEADHRHL